MKNAQIVDHTLPLEQIAMNRCRNSCFMIASAAARNVCPIRSLCDELCTPVWQLSQQFCALPSSLSGSSLSCTSSPLLSAGRRLRLPLPPLSSPPLSGLSTMYHNGGIAHSYWQQSSHLLSVAESKSVSSTLMRRRRPGRQCSQQ